MEKSIYEALKTKKIYSILDGDTKYGDYKFKDGTSIPIAMPYLSGPTLCELCTSFGLSKSYDNSSTMSRWMYFDELISHCIENDTCEKLINYLFSRDNFITVLKGHGASEIKQAYDTIVKVVIDQINGILVFSDAKLILENGIFILRSSNFSEVTKHVDFKLKRGNSVLSAFNVYELKKQVGQGGNGKVWEVIDKYGDSFAIKFLERNNSEKVLKRFKNETFFCMKYSHKNIVPILDYGTVGQEFIFYVMPLYKETLRDKIREKISYDDITEIFIGILDGLRFAHQKGAIHRDIKPENILFEADSMIPVIADFGIAHFTDENLATFVETVKNDRMANFQYAAPEQRKKGGTSVPQTDIYSAALLLNEMFTGEVPQALDYRKIRDIAPEYSYLDTLFEQLFKQEPQERLYPEECIITEMQALATRNANEIESKKLKEKSFAIKELEEYNPKVVTIKYSDGKLLFEIDQPVKKEWFQIIAYESYSHTSVMGYETNRLKIYGENILAMPMRVDESQSTIKDVVANTKDWIISTNGIYKNKMMQQLKNEQREKEQKRLAEIEKLEKENNMIDFLSSLQ